MVMSPRTRRTASPVSRLTVVVALLLATLAGSVTGGPTAAQAQAGGDARSEREKVRSEQAAVASQVDALQADATEVNQALSALQADVSTQRAALSDAQSALASAEAELERLDGEIAATEAELEGLREDLREQAVAAYIEPPAEGGFGALDAESAEESVNKRVFLDLQGASSADVLDQLRGAQARLNAQREDAAAVRAEAEAKRGAVADRAAQVESAYSRQSSFAAQVESRLNDRLAESAALESQDATLSRKIADEEAAVAAQLAAARQRDAQAAAARQTQTATGPSRPSPSIPTTRPTGPVVKPPIVGAGQLVTVGGITVNVAISSQLQGMLGAASASGLNLGGTGYRDSNAQIALRKQNCGTSEYAIWTMSPDACSPPTAIPGRSKHEQGLAIDFSCNGALINSRSSPCFQWLAANASGFGFFNLPSEPWHWSNTGQ